MLIRRGPWVLLGITVLTLVGCSMQPKMITLPRQMTIEQIADAYVHVALSMDVRDPGYVDGYYGPPEWRDQAKAENKSLLAIQNVVAKLNMDLPRAPSEHPLDDQTLEIRRNYLRNQIGSLWARTRMLDGWKPSFEEEAEAIYDVQLPDMPFTEVEAPAQRVISMLSSGSGEPWKRYNDYINSFTIPADKLDAVMRFAITSARDKTIEHIQLPPGEQIDLAYVTGQPWDARAVYQGNLHTRIEINTDQPLSIARALELAVHDGYPGAHVYNTMVDQHLVKDNGWVEYEVHARYSPQAFVTNGVADFAMDLGFTPDERLDVVQQMFKLAGLDPIEARDYVRVVDAGRRMGPAVVEAGRRYRDGKMDRDQTIAWLQQYALYTPAHAEQQVDAFDQHGALAINAALGGRVINHWMQHESGSTWVGPAQWKSFERFLVAPQTPTQMQLLMQNQVDIR